MPRQKRVDEAGVCYHAINRGNARQEIFHKPEDYEAFIRVLSQGLEKYAVELFSFSLMPNHCIWFYCHRKTVKWGVCCGGSRRRIRFVIMPIIIRAAKGTFTKLDSRVFRCKMTFTFMSFVDMSSVIRCEQIWLQKPRLGGTDRFIDGINRPSHFLKSSRHGPCHGCPTGINTSMNQLAKRNCQPFALASIAGVRMAMINGRKKWPTNTAFGQRYDQSGVPVRRSKPPLNDSKHRYYPRPLCSPPLCSPSRQAR